MSTTTRRITAVLGAAFAAIGVATAAGIPAGAEAASTTQPMSAHTVVSTSTDTTGVHVNLSDGGSITVDPAEYAHWRSVTASTVHPLETIPGPCGSSTINFIPIGNHQAKMGTSFYVTPSAISYSWLVSFVDNYGVSAKSYGGPLANRSNWSNNNGFTFTGGGGPTRATVEKNSSWALLNNGSICTSAGPTDSAIVY